MQSNTVMHPNTPTSFGDVRQLILETILNIRDGGLDVQQGMAMAANFKMLNDNIIAEIQAAKLSIATEGKAHSFGSLMRMGTRTINAALPDKTSEVCE